MQESAATIEDILIYHSEAFSQNNLARLTQKYSGQAEIWTPEGI